MDEEGKEEKELLEGGLGLVRGKKVGQKKQHGIRGAKP